ncbi:YjjG family noncanonical pyrimidine nucleotidase [Gillisia sp. M10.2A]|uniref:YjjG family noncanonical pyrimidine nucleotidase n=1 Tax=Gillisia lutea TaxID=2909668 RepID=A0ABS9EH85_9FLAO|nr:YjjG family noncanonical pyrimidine nucleotidase [Gillisia lutea]MCF4102252.1 YjjG family noncanonical pyrimidine nucleotidase [Gillisia lutea]
MKFNNIQHIYFDLDHTLWDFDKNSALTFQSIFRSENLEIGLEEFLKVYVPINSKYWELYRNDQISKESLRTGRLVDSFSSRKVEVPQPVIENLSNKYIQFLPGFNHLLEGTIELLDYLQPKYKLHIITNGFEEVQQTKLQNCNIASYFTTITTSEETGVKKPHLRIFEHALQKSNALPHNSLMIGDNYEADILGAKSYGMHAVYFDYYAKNDAFEIHQVQKLKDLEKYL